MDQTSNRFNKIITILAGLLGISFIIVIHELGHFACAHLFGVPTPVFSLGFGPALFKYPLGNTVFQIALLPIGGYVQLDENILDHTPYLFKIIIMLGGIVFNFILTLVILIYFSFTKSKDRVSIAECVHYLRAHNTSKRPFIGPIGITQLIGQSFMTNIRLFLFMIALISFNVGAFNLLPISFFDGGKVAFYTLEAIAGTGIAEISIFMFSVFLLVLFMAMMTARRTRIVSE